MLAPLRPTVEDERAVLLHLAAPQLDHHHLTSVAA
jgi:hypothetical protein